MADQGAIVAAKVGFARSPKWDDRRKAHLKEHPYCQACPAPKGWKKMLHHGQALVGLKPVQVHHIFPFHNMMVIGRPDMECDQPLNLVTLCESGENHHVLLGHLGDFQSFNPDVIKHAHTFFGKTKEQIKSDPHWLSLSQARPKDIDKMTDAEKQELRALVDRLFPLPKNMG